MTPSRFGGYPCLDAFGDGFPPSTIFMRAWDGSVPVLFHVNQVLPQRHALDLMHLTDARHDDRELYDYAVGIRER